MGLRIKNSYCMITTITNTRGLNKPSLVRRLPDLFNVARKNREAWGRGLDIMHC